MKKTKKNIIFLLIPIIVIGIIGLILGLYLVHNAKNSKSNENEINGIDEGTTYEEFYDWETQLNIKAIRIADEAFNHEYPINDNETFTITLYELQTKYGKNMSQYNTNTITCDLENSVITILKQGESYMKSVQLACTNIEEQ